MKKKILVTGLTAAAVALSGTAFANNWLLYLPAILAGSEGETEPPPEATGNNWLLYLPAILAGSQGGGATLPEVTGALNDTGIVTKVGTTGEEDADYGRDVTDSDNTDGDAGFSFTKLDSTGKELAASSTSWACVLDNVTGLVWEVKTADNTGITYDWAGANSYAAAFTGCGSSYTCRLPTVKELYSIVSLGASSSPFIDTNYFPNTGEFTIYLTATEVANAPDTDSVDVWAVNFFSGFTDTAIDKTDSGSYSVRAVCVAK
jgi:hypothetical protein